MITFPLQIFKYLQLRDWLTCADVCCEWKAIIQSGSLWSEVWTHTFSLSNHKCSQCETEWRTLTLPWRVSERSTSLARKTGSPTAQQSKFCATTGLLWLISTYEAAHCSAGPAWNTSVSNAWYAYPCYFQGNDLSIFPKLFYLVKIANIYTTQRICFILPIWYRLFNIVERQRGTLWMKAEVKCSWKSGEPEDLVFLRHSQVAGLQLLNFSLHLHRRAPQLRIRLVCVLSSPVPVPRTPSVVGLDIVLHSLPGVLKRGATHQARVPHQRVQTQPVHHVVDAERMQFEENKSSN